MTWEKAVNNMIFEAGKALQRIKAFLFRQKHNYRVAVVRSSASTFLVNLTAQYNSIYVSALGANSVQLGIISSFGSAVSAMVSAPLGWLMDRYSLKRFYLLGVIMMGGAVAIYAIAQDWQVIIAAVILFSVAMRFTGTGCSVICADSVSNKDRVTAQNLCVTTASLLSLLAPLIAAPLVTAFGGLTAQGIRPLYGMRFGGYILIFVFLAFQLKELERPLRGKRKSKLHFLEDFRKLFRSPKPLKRWIFVSSFTMLPMAMTTPFFQLFAHQAKGADQYLLGLMTAASIFTRLLFGIPLGRLADRIGRKKVIYLLTPLWYTSYLLLIFFSNPVALILAGAFLTFYNISSGIISAMTIELVPVERMGRWTGLLGLFRGLIVIPAPLLGGLIWQHWGPAYVFVVPLIIDLLIKIPLLSTIPETLKSQDSQDVGVGE
jgi:MFS family permease